MYDLSIAAEDVLLTFLPIGTNALSVILVLYCVPSKSVNKTKACCLNVSILDKTVDNTCVSPAPLNLFGVILASSNFACNFQFKKLTGLNIEWNTIFFILGGIAVVEFEANSNLNRIRLKVTGDVKEAVIVWLPDELITPELPNVVHVLESESFKADVSIL